MQTAGQSLHTALACCCMTWGHVCTENLEIYLEDHMNTFCKAFHFVSSMFFALFSSEQIEMQLAEYHKLARKLKLIPISAENSNGHDFEIQFNPEAGPNCLVKYRTQIKVSQVNTEYFCYSSQKKKKKKSFIGKVSFRLRSSMKLP